MESASRRYGPTMDSGPNVDHALTPGRSPARAGRGCLRFRGPAFPALFRSFLARWVEVDCQSISRACWSLRPRASAPGCSVLEPSTSALVTSSGWSRGSGDRSRPPRLGVPRDGLGDLGRQLGWGQLVAVADQHQRRAADAAEPWPRSFPLLMAPRARHGGGCATRRRVAHPPAAR
jgi:hypothetical protein